MVVTRIGVRERFQTDEPAADWQAWVTAEGQLKLQTPTGEIIRVRGILKGPPGRDAQPPSVEVIARAVLAYFKHHPVPTPLDGRTPTPEEVAAAVKAFIKANPIRVPKDGDPGPKPTFKEIYSAVEAFLKAHPIPVPKDGYTPVKGVDYADGKPGDDGDDGDIGPVPRHELDPPENPFRIRFELFRNPDGKTTKWGKWIDLRSLLPKLIPQQPARAMGPISLDRQQIIQLIEDNAVSVSSEVQHTHAAIHVTASGNTTVLTPTTGKCISIVRLSALSDMDEADSPLIKIGFGTSGGAIATEYARGAVVSMRQLKVGAVNQSVIVNLESAAKVDGTIIYDEV